MLTPRQAQVLVFIDRKIAETGVCPSYREIMAEIGAKSPGSVHALVTRLEAHGFVARPWGSAGRSIAIVKVPKALRRGK